jgi:hypothetical protein
MASTPDKPKKKAATGSAARVGATVKRATTRKRVASLPNGTATHEAIALRAYELYASGVGGDAVEHWLQAERELVAA